MNYFLVLIVNWVLSCLDNIFDEIFFHSHFIDESQSKQSSSIAEVLVILAVSSPRQVLIEQLHSFFFVVVVD